MNKTHVTVAVVLALVISGLGFVIGRWNTPATLVVTQEVPVPGATPGNQLPSCVTFGGVTECTLRGSWTSTATTTPCDIPNALAASSTIQEIVVNVTGATSSAAVFTLATSTVQNATTSLITTLSLAAGAQGALHWHGGTNNAVLGPNNRIVVGVSGVSQGGYTLGGSCYAKTRAVAGF